MSLACAREALTPVDEAKPDAANPSSSAAKLVRFDIRELRPTTQNLADRFGAMHSQAQHEDKDTAVFFSADWCTACRDVELDLGGAHPQSEIGHVRILQLKEEAWEREGRIDEFNTLRGRWTGEFFTYPMVVLLDAQGKKIEDMNQAKARLEAAGQVPTFQLWFAGVGAKSKQTPSMGVAQPS